MQEQFQISMVTSRPKLQLAIYKFCMHLRLRFAFCW